MLLDQSFPVHFCFVLPSPAEGLAREWLDFLGQQSVCDSCWRWRWCRCCWLLLVLVVLVLMVVADATTT